MKARHQQVFTGEGRHAVVTRVPLVRGSWFTRMDAFELETSYQSQHRGSHAVGLRYYLTRRAARRNAKAFVAGRIEVPGYSDYSLRLR